MTLLYLINDLENLAQDNKLLNILNLVALFIVAAALVLLYVKQLQISIPRADLPQHIEDLFIAKDILEHVPSGLIVHDEKMRITETAAGANEIVQWSGTELKQKLFTTLLTEESEPKYLDMISRLKATGQPYAKTGFTVLTVNKSNGDIAEVDVRTSMWTTNGKMLFGVVIKDLSKDRQEVELCRKKMEMIAFAETEIGFGVWKWNVITNEVLVDEGFKVLFELNKDVVTAKDLMLSVHQEDLKAVENAINAAFEKFQDYVVEYRIVKRNRAEIKVRCWGYCIYENGGDKRLMHIAGAIQKIN